MHNNPVILIFRDFIFNYLHGCPFLNLFVILQSPEAAWERNRPLSCRVMSDKSYRWK